MEDLKKKQVIKRRLYGRVVRITLIILFLLLIKPTWNIYQKSRESDRNLNRAQEEVRALEQRQKELSASINNLKSESGRDEEIRAKFGVAKEGETVVVIVDEKKPVSVDKKTVPLKPSPASAFWSRILSWVGIK